MSDSGAVDAVEVKIHHLVSEPVAQDQFRAHGATLLLLEVLLGLGLGLALGLGLGLEVLLGLGLGLEVLLGLCSRLQALSHSLTGAVRPSRDPIIIWGCRAASGPEASRTVRAPSASTHSLSQLSETPSSATSFQCMSGAHLVAGIRYAGPALYPDALIWFLDSSGSSCTKPPKSSNS